MAWQISEWAQLITGCLAYTSQCKDNDIKKNVNKLANTN